MNEELKELGALIDVRTEEAKKKDYRFEEVVASVAPVNWIEKPVWRKFPIFNQNGSGSCVAQTLRKMAGVYIWLKTQVFIALSASHIYQRRSNKPAAGMSGVNVFEVGQKGITLEEFAPSENMSDAQMDAVQVLPFMEEVGKVFKLGNYLVVPIKDIDTIASIIQTTGKAVMVWFYFQGDEWGNVPVVKNPNLTPENAPARHSIAAVDFTLYNGEKAIIIDESWGQGTALNGQRIITESFFKQRNFFAAHFMNFAFEIAPVAKPKYTFTKDLQFEMTDPDVKALQDVLKYEGLFPANAESTGYFGAITKKGVQDWQIKHKIVSSGAGFGRVGPLTRAKLNSIYS